MMLTWFARDETPVLMGRRLTLRAPRPADYTAWRTLRRDSRDFLRPFEPRWSEADLTQRVYLERLRRGARRPAPVPIMPSSSSCARTQPSAWSAG